MEPGIRRLEGERKWKERRGGKESRSQTRRRTRTRRGRGIKTGKDEPHSIGIEHILKDDEGEVEVSSEDAGSKAEGVGLPVGSETCWEGIAEGVEDWVGEGDGWVIAEGVNARKKEIKGGQRACSTKMGKDSFGNEQTRERWEERERRGDELVLVKSMSCSLDVDSSPMVSSCVSPCKKKESNEESERESAFRS